MDELEIPLGKRTRFYRFFEMLPALLSYFTILLPVLLSLIDPLLGAIFVIVYIIIWFVKAIAMSVRSIQGFQTLERAKKVDWSRRLADLDDPSATLRTWSAAREREWKSDVHHHNVERLAATEDAKRPSEIYNVIIIATYNESREILEPTIQAVLASDYDMKRVILAIAYEERGGESIASTVKALERQYSGEFGQMHCIMHPDGLPNEVVGKGGNITYAGRELHARLAKQGIESENVIVTTLDADNRPHKTYFAYMTYEYVVHPEPRYA
ncbi:MAG TPA: hypothetical protein PKD68_05025, partial [Candidatus Saccharibacteria bacterium]|nr:hypothetical protein [Candidatus Saccharibacteria bacterium]